MKTLLIDDHEIVRKGLKDLIKNIPEIGEVIEAGNAAEAMDKINTENFDLFVLDISLPDRNGLELLKDIKSISPKSHVLILSMHDNPQYATRSLKAGADGYITKSEAFDEIRKAVENVKNGRKYVSSNIALELTFTSMEEDKPLHSSLSDREFEVFILLAEGKQPKEIADILFINPKTVSTYRKRIFEKMGFSNNSELTRYALKNNLIQ